MSALAISHLTKRFGPLTALEELSIEVAEGEFFCIVGPTNAGKSTLLKLVAGLHRPNSGRIAIKGRDVTTVEPAEREVSLLFQNIALFPTLNGFDNIAFPLRQLRLAPEIVASRVDALAKLLRLEHLLQRLPRTYSGGEQQRVAIGRALIRPGNVLMLDEPLTNLDARLRIALRIEFKKLHRETGQTILYVTHDQIEAMSLSDRIAVLNNGRVQQIGTPDEIYLRPANRFVATFIGSPPMNIFDAEIQQSNGEFRVVGGGFDIALSEANGHVLSGMPREIAVGIRPEHVRVSPVKTEDTPIPAEATWIERLGTKSIITIRIGSKSLKALVKTGHPVRKEGGVWAGFVPNTEHFLDRKSDMFFHRKAEL